MVKFENVLNFTQKDFKMLSWEFFLKTELNK